MVFCGGVAGDLCDVVALGAALVFLGLVGQLNEVVLTLAMWFILFTLIMGSIIIFTVSVIPIPIPHVIHIPIPHVIHIPIHIHVSHYLIDTLIKHNFDFLAVQLEGKHIIITLVGGHELQPVVGDPSQLAVHLQVNVVVLIYHTGYVLVGHPLLVQLGLLVL